jgi:hypothetical protein
MWAFMRRLGFIDRKFIYTHLSEIKKCHDFSFVKFEFYSLANDFFSLRRKLLNKRIGKNHTIVPERNIFEYVNKLAKDFK